MKVVLAKFNLTKMDLTYVKDEGAYLNSLTTTLISIVTYNYF